MSSRSFIKYLNPKCIAALAMMFAASLMTSGCAPIALSSARQKMAAGQYPAAHSELETLAARTDLSPSDRREVLDDLCNLQGWSRPTGGEGKMRRAQLLEHAYLTRLQGEVG